MAREPCRKALDHTNGRMPAAIAVPMTRTPASLPAHKRVRCTMPTQGRDVAPEVGWLLCFSVPAARAIRHAHLHRLTPTAGA
jgi:hypothetical protein